MAVKRIVPNIAASGPWAGKPFYGDLLGLELVMDMGWIVTFAGPANQSGQLSIASEGGSGTPVPNISIEVDDLDAVLARVRAAGLAPVYGPGLEPWGVRRFYLRDPFGRQVNILTHGSR